MVRQHSAVNTDGCDTGIETRRSDRTRAAILTAARAEFAARGECATIRTIAATANVDPALVMRYFETKEKLYSAALEVDLDLPDLRSVPPEQLGERIIRHFVRKWDSQRHGETYMFLFRAAVTNEVGAERMRAVFREQVLPHTTRLVASADEAEQRAAAVMTQLLGIGACRYFLRIPPLVDLDVDELAARFGPTIQHYLTGPGPATALACAVVDPVGESSASLRRDEVQSLRYAPAPR